MRFIPAAGGGIQPRNRRGRHPPGKRGSGPACCWVGRHGGARQIAVEGRPAPASHPTARDGAAAALWAVARAARAAG